MPVYNSAHFVDVFTLGEPPMGPVVGVLRLAITFLAMLVGVVAILVTGYLPLQVRGVRLPAWIVHGLARLYCFLYRVRVHGDVEGVRAAHGFIFPNHQSYLDAIVIASLLPARFLADAGISRYPVVGKIVAGLGTIFLEREDKNDRKKARVAVADALRRQLWPPVVLFPEGRLNKGDALHQFRFGAFAIAAENEVPYTLLAIRYSRPDVVVWRGLCMGPIDVELTIPTRVEPERDDDPVLLSDAAETAIATALGIEIAPGQEKVP
jgi:1-acyl-sn-glycerol-3-phosphate acyltransferase